MSQLLTKSLYLVAVLLALAETKSYYGAQVLRIDKIYQNITFLEEEFGGSLWKEDTNFTDISFDKEKLQETKKFLNTENIPFEVIIWDLQNLIDKETEGISLFGRSSLQSNMTWDRYHSLDTIYNFMRKMETQYPDLVKIIPIGKSVENRDLLVLRLANGTVDKKKIWIDSGIHAREWIAPAASTYVINHILTNWEILPDSITGKTWYFMPVVNPDGYVYSQTTDRLWRKNRRPLNRCDGVDLNRNYNVDFRSNTQSLGYCSETYSGPSAFSEPETSAIQQFLYKNRYNLKASLSVHSYGQYIIYPWGFTHKRAPNYKYMDKIARIAAKNIEALTGQTYKVAQDTILGLISGAADDWAKKHLKVLLTYTIELRDKGYNGFLLTCDEIIDTSKELLEIAKAVADGIVN